MAKSNPSNDNSIAAFWHLVPLPSLAVDINGVSRYFVLYCTYPFLRPFHGPPPFAKLPGCAFTIILSQDLEGFNYSSFPLEGERILGPDLSVSLAVS
jgi:hypothetical protein